MSRSWRISVPLLILLASPRLAFLQTTMGTITGLVTDSTGAVVPGAAVEARNLDTGGESKTTTSATGNYSLPGLRVGHYRVDVSQPGFKAWSRADITLSSADNVRADAVLQVGQTSESIEVTGEGCVEDRIDGSVHHDGAETRGKFAAADCRYRRRNAQCFQPDDHAAAGPNRRRTKFLGRFQRRRRPAARMERQCGWTFGGNGMAESCRLHEPSDAASGFCAGVSH